MAMVMCLSISSGPASATVIGFDFIQHGFSEGAFVSGMFYGEDLNMDGQLSFIDGELTDMMLEFSGNSFVSAFSLVLGDTGIFAGVVYDLDGGPLGDGFNLDIEGLASNNLGGGGPLFYVAGPGPVAECGIGVVCAILGDGIGPNQTSTELIYVTAKSVPEPVTFILLSLGLFGLGFNRRKRI